MLMIRDEQDVLLAGLFAGPNCSGPAKIPAVLQDPEQDQQKTFIFVFFPGISMNLLSTAPQGLFSPKISLEMLPLPLLPCTPLIYTLKELLKCLVSTEDVSLLAHAHA